MAESSSALTPIRIGEVALGKPLPWPVYDVRGKLLLQRGFVIANATQLEGVVANGFFVDDRWQPGHGQAFATVKPRKAGHAGTRQAEEVMTPAMAPATVVRMEEVRWHIGETFFLQSAENPKIRYAVPLLGFAKNQTILVGLPMVEGKLEFVREGQSFVVRAFASKKAYAFSAVAVKAALTPHPYLHLSWPKQVGCTLVRQDSRAAVRIIASVSLDEPERVAAATLSDLSVGGCSGLLKQPLGVPGEEGRIKFRVCAAGTDEYLNLKMILRSVVPAADGSGELQHGFEFVEVPRRERLVLTAFVHQTLVDLD